MAQLRRSLEDAADLSSCESPDVLFEAAPSEDVALWGSAAATHLGFVV